MKAATLVEYDTSFATQYPMNMQSVDRAVVAIAKQHSVVTGFVVFVRSISPHHIRADNYVRAILDTQIVLVAAGNRVADNHHVACFLNVDIRFDVTKNVIGYRH
ncbi:hypothetical protein DTL42_05150 [Bremerella cremea]|uniref:Uncharacterized protein n=1 Tax=Bremerella cremea TaxID=1031537 RepID=A0A368KVZ1_9BACT|nr:hypothetical protein DTL42_05150 [Bremerella cremea]